MVTIDFYETSDSRLHFRSVKKMTSLWLIWLMDRWIWVTKVENCFPGSKSLKIGLQIVWNMRKNISKICRRILNLPEVMGVLVRPEMKNFWTGSRKILFSKACEKLFRESYSHFSIPRHQTAVEVFEVLSVTMTSSPEVVRTRKKIIDFRVFGPTEFSSKTYIERFTCLRFARQVSSP